MSGNIQIWYHRVNDSLSYRVNENGYAPRYSGLAPFVLMADALYVREGPLDFYHVHLVDIGCGWDTDRLLRAMKR